MRKYIIASAVVSAAAVAAIATSVSASASTTDVLTYGSAGGTNISVGDTLASNLSSGTDATFYTTTSGTSGITCTSGAMTEKITANPAAGGSATATAKSTSFSGCSNNLGDSETNATIHGYSVTMNSSGGVNTGSVTAVLTLSAATCDYSSSGLAGSSEFTNQAVGYTGGSGTTSDCPTTLYFSATWGAAGDTSVSGDPEVFVNS